MSSSVILLLILEKIQYLKVFLLKSKFCIIYYFFCLSENITVNNIYDKCKDFCKQIGEGGVAKESISKFYRVVKNRLREKMHSKWQKTVLGEEINIKLGYGSVEIDESKIISSGYQIIGCSV